MSLKLDVQHLADPEHTNFGVQLLRLFAKADMANQYRLRGAFPNAHTVYNAWALGPDPAVAGDGHIPDLPYDFGPWVCSRSGPPPPPGPDALLIAAAPDLLAACELAHNAIDLLVAMLIQRDDAFYPSESGLPWQALLAVNAATAKPKAARSAQVEQ